MIQHSSETVEAYTSGEIAGRVHGLMGGIDLDPCSCALANEVVGAAAWYGPGSAWGEDGLVLPFCGRMYVNPPGLAVRKEEVRVRELRKKYKVKSRPAIWWCRLVEGWLSGEVEQAVFMGFALEIIRTTQSAELPIPLDFPRCFPKKRLPFGTVNAVQTSGKGKGKLIAEDKPEGAWVLRKQPGHPNVIVWLPPLTLPEAEWIDGFREHFGTLGACRY